MIEGPLVKFSGIVTYIVFEKKITSSGNFLPVGCLSRPLKALKMNLCCPRILSTDLGWDTYWISEKKLKCCSFSHPSILPLGDRSACSHLYHKLEHQRPASRGTTETKSLSALFLCLNLFLLSFLNSLSSPELDVYLRSASLMMDLSDIPV